ncbi:solute carrier family 25 member 24, like isoform X2 [Oncorhynchus mykiss]|uniref:solute carrier family 25 member 24, like isoform X2 n=1 Tax=Oncorhynchus mykiss TaxID=8022 RepID=UPI0018788E3F|nr:solute carrier family 25 member 24, like isoform X2 [Oncorhynchus mykiss]
MDQFRGLFVKLDKNNDGSISVEELHNEMKKTGIMAADQKAQTVVNNYDRNKDGRLDYDEFLSYMSDREKKWRIHFMALDKNKCGVIGQEEIIDLFKELGVNISKPNAKRIIQMMDEDSSMTVDWGEFLQHVILNPAENLGELVTSWKHTLVFDVGESRTMPLELPPDLSAGSGEWRSFVLAAGLADAVSRTLTAPIDRLKTQLQVYGSKASSQGFRELKAGGVRSMWQGNAVNVLKGTPQSTLQCLIYAQMKVYTQRWQQESLSVQQRFGLGCVSGAVAHAVFYPLEVLKVRLNLWAGTYSGVVQCARSIYRNESAASFYRGFRPSILCMIPYAGVECAVHQFCGLLCWTDKQLSSSCDQDPAASSGFQFNFTHNFSSGIHRHL